MMKTISTEEATGCRRRTGGLVWEEEDKRQSRESYELGGLGCKLVPWALLGWAGQCWVPDDVRTRAGKAIGSG